jgi:hypothetical protein|tara:strand:+ start:435 stop:734 length:300 start_codon:yes stop_codon:yes gene_type:complete
MSDVNDQPRKLIDVFNETGVPRENTNTDYTQTYQLQKATQNGVRVKAIDASGNSLQYINLRDHDVPYVYLSKALLDRQRNGGKLPIEFTITIKASAWEE